MYQEKGKHKSKKGREGLLLKKSYFSFDHGQVKKVDNESGSGGWSDFQFVAEGLIILKICGLDRIGK